ncbi:Protein PHYTOCHROME KINASE SUBSTRATE 3 [Raphanus sativus]|uniref:Protein PHYTOCHROME KINASE SUBSTRATE 3 n=1 Tax=Raphanus sativus TaxID=3726 RepID=A0A6J0KNN9_RAPSA|nr:protein PHYTOCHROME KINASE SUBSTRATE 3 [Raphanus sativus]KAJ4879485.1 Protein PHYTOCHROME KINASE SUBSTRATE 3 [Raphanus sativus]
MGDEKKSTHFRQISTHKPQLLVLSSIQEQPSSKISDKPTIKASVADVDSEIGVFGAEKYFSMKLDHVDSMVDINKQPEKENKEYHHHPYPHTHTQLTKTTSSRSRTSRHGTPSVRSESSYNSQTFLMRLNTNNDNKQRKTNDASVSFGGFRCNGPCSGVKTINTDRKISGRGRNYDRDFLAYDARKHMDKAKPIIPIPIQRSDIAMNLERKLSMLTWDAIPNHKNNIHKNGNNSSVSSKTQLEEEEAASEASSDLFEIENITSSVYEPSEVSIGWSVVTGSMAEQSVISDFDTLKRGMRGGSVVKTKPVVAEKVRSGGFLSGCKSHKAVSVVDSTRNVKEAAKVNHHEISQHKKFKTEIRIQDLSFL